MIVTLTAHPSLDRTIDLVAPLRPGEVQSTRGIREDAGGKGVNVSRVVAAAGIRTRAVLPLAPHDPYAALLADTGLAHTAVPIAASARANVTLAAPDGVTTKLNVPGPTLDGRDAARLTDAVVGAADAAHWLVLAGSLPPGLPEDFYVTVAAAVRTAWGTSAPRIAVDTSGPALRAVVDAGQVDLIKPNELELAELAGLTLDPALRDDTLLAALLPAARRVVPARVGAALVTLGAAGAVLVTGDGAWHAPAPPTVVRSTVGAGDTALAGYLLADLAGAPSAARLSSAVRYGAAAASLPGTAAATPRDLPADPVTPRPL